MTDVVIGLGEMGGVFAHGLLRGGRTVAPVTRAMRMHDVASTPELAVVAVGEEALARVLSEVPLAWRDRLVLLQNELLPDDWTAHGIVQPTIAIVWFEKKRDKPLRVVLPTVVGGPRAAIVVEALSSLGIAAREIAESELPLALVEKNLYILASNIAGLEVGGTVRELATQHAGLLADVASEIIALQAFRLAQPLPNRALLDALHRAFEADPEHACTGRSAPARLRRALAIAERAGLRVPTLARIAARVGLPT